MFVLHLVFDEVFCDIDVYKEVFEKIGIRTLPLLLTKNGQPIKDTVQLILPQANAALRLSGYPYMKCGDEKKYDIIFQGFFPPFESKIAEELQIFKSIEYFGVGAEARKYLFITQSLRKALEEAGVVSRYYAVAK